ncbi:MAG TPA: 50S ribosomal protein L38e [Candidatus Bathyarchaeia archaeon]|jgi:large subunit ribosomal protein L38e|nr:50S ribosomal protein L38e [Candidatus Bathyarchaeia archaeon]
MPREINNVDEFIKLSEKAEICRIRKYDDIVRLKLRTRKVLYTLKVEPAKLDEVVKKLKCKTEEV